MARRGSLDVLMALAVLVTSGCAGTKQQPTLTDGGGGTITGAGTGHGGTGGGTGFGLGGTFATDGPSRVIGGDALGDAACATTSQQAQQVPLDLYLMMDSSGSMLETLANGQTKWAAVTSALTSFLQDTNSIGLGVGLQYFPLLAPGVPSSCQSNDACNGAGLCQLSQSCSQPTSRQLTPCTNNSDCVGQGVCGQVGLCGTANSTAYCVGVGGSCPDGTACIAYCNGRDSCSAPAYAAPAVEIATLPAAAPALEASLNARTPDGLTPTAAALSGAISHAQARARANPTHKVAVLLATDGEPDECTPDDIAGVSMIASDAQAGTPSISTYVIGVFASADAATAQTNLNTLASAGGTNQAFIVNTSQNVTQSFVNALNSVRSSGLACQYMVPAPAGDGATPDYFSVNVEFTSGSGQTVTIGNVKDRASCSATQGGWYYDVDPSTGATPQTITICDTSCTQLKSDPTGRVDILLGCKTIYIIS